MEIKLKFMVSIPANSTDAGQTAPFEWDAGHKWVKVDSVKMLSNFGKNKTKKQCVWL